MTSNKTCSRHTTRYTNIRQHNEATRYRAVIITNHTTLRPGTVVCKVIGGQDEDD